MIDKNKQYRTRDGREVRIYATDGVGTHTVHGAIKTEQGWRSQLWRDDGYFVPYATDNDLIEVRPRIKREVWVNVYRGREIDWMTIHDERDEADDYPDYHKTRIACVKLTIDCEEGEGL
jgi:hypothetical protein